MMNLKKVFACLVIPFTLAACQKQSYYMTLSEKDATVEVEGGSVQLTLTTNTYVRVNNDMSEWVKISNSAVVGDATQMILEVQPNPNLEERVGTIRFIGDYVTPLKYTLTQKPVVPVGVDPAEISALRKDTSAKFRVLGDKPWTLTCDNPAFVPNVTSGTGETTVTVTFPVNETEEEAVANITVKIEADTYTVKITQAGYPKKIYQDLSADGTSNCYIVSNAGYYKFKATVRGNGVRPASQTLETSISPETVKVLWTSLGTSEMPADDSVISEVELKDGYVQFSAGVIEQFVNGNAVIAAQSATGEIIWSWHIWVTEAVGQIEVGTDKWMDRNLGALCANIKNDPLAFGLHYQWGRKDPFRTAQNFDDDVKLIATTGTWPEPVLMAEGVGGVENSIKQPQTFFYVSGSKHNNKDWIWGVQYDDLWGAGAEASTSSFTIAETKKSMFDPCPVGYCIPTSLQHKNLADTFELSKTCIDKDNHGMGNENFWLCYPSGPVYDSGKFDSGSCQPVGTYSWYAGSCTNGINMMCTRSHSTACNFGGATSARCAGYSVRCVKE